MMYLDTTMAKGKTYRSVSARSHGRSKKIYLGTVGALDLNQSENLSAGTSTGGTFLASPRESKHGKLYDAILGSGQCFDCQ